MVSERKFAQIIIDLDGTLVEESARLEAQASAVSEKFGSSHEEMQNVINAFFVANDKAVAEGGKDKNNLSIYIRWMGETLNIPVDETESKALAEAWKNAYEESLHAPTLFDDVLPFLTGLKELGYEPVLATGGKEMEKRQLMEKVGINTFFKKVFASAEVGFQKQDTNFWKQVLKDLSVSSKKVLVIGNQINDDIWRTSELGMSTVFIKRPDALFKNLGPDTVKPDYEVHDLREIISLI
jgi:FMN phosphatase YigB (HAD superfamily)